MVTYIIARQMGGKPVITVSGEELGYLDDILIDEHTGEFLSLLVQPVAETTTSTYQKDRNGNLVIPFEAVNGVGKVIVVKD